MQATSFLQKRIKKRYNSRPILVFICSEINLGGKDVVRIETKRNAKRYLEAMSEQTCPDEQHTGEPDLSDHQYRMPSLPL